MQKFRIKKKQEKNQNIFFYEYKQTHPDPTLNREGAKENI